MMREGRGGERILRKGNELQVECDVTRFLSFMFLRDVSAFYPPFRATMNCSAVNE